MSSGRTSRREHRVLIFVCGASGFIGRALVAELLRRDHRVRAASRHPDRQIFPSGDIATMALDFAAMIDVARWKTLIDGCDAVVNTVGIFRETGTQTFRRLHVEAPRALFYACAAQHIERVLQLSALGADDGAKTAYHRSKRAADEILLERVPTGVCAQPSLVFGRDGASARWFTTLAALPLVPVPLRGEQCVQPIHVDDLVVALCRLIEDDGVRGRVPLVGPTPVTLRAYLGCLRHAMRLGDARFVPIPRFVVETGVGIARLAPGMPFDRDAWAMLKRGNFADAGVTARLLGHDPRPPAAFIEGREAHDVRVAAQLRFLLPVLRTAVALLWIASGVVSLGLYPLDASYALLAQTGITGPWAPLFLYGAASLDIALGVLVFVLRGRRRRRLWRTQMALVVAYTVIISWALPEYWLHPYGPVTKNLPLLAALWLLDALEDSR